MTRQRLAYKKIEKRQACETCVIAKQRCIPGRKRACQRCTRLQKECNPQSLSLESSSPKPKQPSRLDQIERKLDTLLATSKTTDSAYQLQNDASTTSSTPSVSTPYIAHNPLPATSNISNYTLQPVLPPLLDDFQTLCRDFPFVIVHDSVDELSRTKPLLFKTIRMVVCRDSHLQYSLGEQIRRDIAEQLIVKGEKSLGVLQGLLLALAFYHLHVNVNLQAMNLIHLTMAQVVDLELDKPPNAKDLRKTPLGPLNFGRPRSGTRTLDDMRAYLGAFYLSSCLATNVKRFEALPYTAYTSECCHQIQQANQYPTDSTLVQLVELQRFAQRISYILPHDEPNIPESSLRCIEMTMLTLQSQLDKFLSTLPETITSSTSFRLQSLAVSAHLHQTAITFPSSYSQPQRTTFLLKCLDSCQRFFEVLFSIPPDQGWTFSYAAGTQTIHTLVVLCRLATLDDPGWDLEYVRSIIDLAAVLDHVIRKFTELRTARSAGSDGLLDTTPTARALGHLSQIKVAYEKKLSKGNDDERQMLPSQVGGDMVLDRDLWSGFEDFVWLDMLWQGDN